MNTFLAWIKSNDKKQRGVAAKLGISMSTLHDILRKGHMPSLRLAYEIEQYTKGAITVYDWVDQPEKKKKDIANSIANEKAKKINE